jgi:lipoate-protein ligase A
MKGAILNNVKILLDINQSLLNQVFKKRPIDIESAIESAESFIRSIEALKDQELRIKNNSYSDQELAEINLEFFEKIESYKQIATKRGLDLKHI